MLRVESLEARGVGVAILYVGALFYQSARVRSGICATILTAAPGVRRLLTPVLVVAINN